MMPCSSGSDRHSIQTSRHLATKLGIQNAITHMGRIDGDRALADWYNAADVLVFPSSWEGFRLATTGGDGLRNACRWRPTFPR